MSIFKSISNLLAKAQWGGISAIVAVILFVFFLIDRLSRHSESPQVIDSAIIKTTPPITQPHKDRIKSPSIRQKVIDSSYNISGHVTDLEDSPLDSVKVSINGNAETFSDKQGYFQLHFLSSEGKIEKVYFNKAGYKQTNVDVPVPQNNRVDSKLKKLI